MAVSAYTIKASLGALADWGRAQGVRLELITKLEKLRDSGLESSWSGNPATLAHLRFMLAEIERYLCTADTKLSFFESPGGVDMDYQKRLFEHLCTCLTDECIANPKALFLQVTFAYQQVTATTMDLTSPLPLTRMKGGLRSALLRKVKTDDVSEEVYDETVSSAICKLPWVFCEGNAIPVSCFTPKIISTLEDGENFVAGLFVKTLQKLEESKRGSYFKAVASYLLNASHIVPALKALKPEERNICDLLSPEALKKSIPDFFKLSEVALMLPLAQQTILFNWAVKSGVIKHGYQIPYVVGVLDSKGCEKEVILAHASNLFDKIQEIEGGYLVDSLKILLGIKTKTKAKAKPKAKPKAKIKKSPSPERMPLACEVLMGNRKRIQSFDDLKVLLEMVALSQMDLETLLVDVTGKDKLVTTSVQCVALLELFKQQKRSVDEIIDYAQIMLERVELSTDEHKSLIGIYFNSLNQLKALNLSMPRDQNDLSLLLSVAKGAKGKGAVRSSSVRAEHLKIIAKNSATTPENFLACAKALLAGIKPNSDEYKSIVKVLIDDAMIIFLGKFVDQSKIDSGVTFLKSLVDLMKGGDYLSQMLAKISTSSLAKANKGKFICETLKYFASNATSFKERRTLQTQLATGWGLTQQEQLGFYKASESAEFVRAMLRKKDFSREFGLFNTANRKAFREAITKHAKVERSLLKADIKRLRHNELNQRTAIDVIALLLARYIKVRKSESHDTLTWFGKILEWLFGGFKRQDKLDAANALQTSLDKFTARGKLSAPVEIALREKHVALTRTGLLSDIYSMVLKASIVSKDSKATKVSKAAKASRVGETKKKGAKPPRPRG